MFSIFPKGANKFSIIYSVQASLTKFETCKVDDGGLMDKFLFFLNLKPFGSPIKISFSLLSSILFFMRT